MLNWALMETAKGMAVHDDVSRQLLSGGQIAARVAELGAQITADYRACAAQGERIVMVGILRGAAIFMADLARAIELPVEIAALMRKQHAGQVPLDCRYVGFEGPDEFIVGYGLDFAERYRNLPYIGVLKPEIYL